MSQSNPKILICLTRTNKFYGKIIRWATGSNVNHSLIKYEDPFWGKWRAIEINEDGPHGQPISQLNRIDGIEHWACTVDLYPGLKSMADEVGDRGYDFKGLISGLLRLIWKKITGREILEPAHSGSKWFCSEFVSEVLKRSNVPGTEDWDTANISPAILHKFFVESPYFVQVDDPLE